MKLTIAIITMNRAQQLKESIESCFCSVLPNDTEFVIIDNASTDETKCTIEGLFRGVNYRYYYEKLGENLGVGKGRNYAFSKATGEYVYFLDDDAYIDNSNNNSFFIDSIKILDDDKSIQTLTTQIYDLLWHNNRVEIDGPIYKEGLYKCYRFCGGSHFLRKSFFEGTEPYFPNKYGLEEIFPSLRVVDEGGVNIFVPALNVIHNPKYNKWTTDNKELLEKEVVCKYGMKSMVYPVCTIPVLYLAFVVRGIKALGLGRLIKVHKKIKEVKNTSVKTKRIRYSTLFSIYKDFGFSIF